MSRISGLRRIFRFPWRTGAQIEHEVDAELRFHLDRRTEELVEQGMTPEAARREAVRQFGDLAKLKDAIPFEAEKPPNAPATRRAPNQWYCRLDEGSWHDGRARLIDFVRDVEDAWRKHDDPVSDEPEGP